MENVREDPGMTCSWLEWRVQTRDPALSYTLAGKPTKLENGIQLHGWAVTTRRTHILESRCPFDRDCAADPCDLCRSVLVNTVNQLRPFMLSIVSHSVSPAYHVKVQHYTWFTHSPDGSIRAKLPLLPTPHFQRRNQGVSSLLLLHGAVSRLFIPSVGRSSDRLHGH